MTKIRNVDVLPCRTNRDPDIDLLLMISYARGPVDSEQRGKIEAHLAKCLKCRQMVKGMTLKGKKR